MELLNFIERTASEQAGEATTITLHDALQETGCAICIENQCITSVERLPDETFLLMVRRGVCILGCTFCNWDFLMKRPGYDKAMWHPARVEFKPHVPFVQYDW